MKIKKLIVTFLMCTLLASCENHSSESVEETLYVGQYIVDYEVGIDYVSVDFDEFNRIRTPFLKNTHPDLLHFSTKQKEEWSSLEDFNIDSYSLLPGDTLNFKKTDNEYIFFQEIGDNMVLNTVMGYVQEIECKKGNVVELTLYKDENSHYTLKENEKDTTIYQMKKTIEDDGFCNFDVALLSIDYAQYHYFKDLPNGTKIWGTYAPDKDVQEQNGIKTCNLRAAYLFNPNKLDYYLKPLGQIIYE